MKYDKEQLKQLCITAVTIAHNVVKELGDEGVAKVKVPGKDIVTKADLAVSQRWREFFKAQQIPIKVYTEESRDDPFESRDDALFLGVGDEIDGTSNFNRSRFIFPSCAIFTIYDSIKPRFKDALATAVLDHNSENIWCAVRGGGCYFNERRVHTSGKDELGSDTYVIIDNGPCVKPESLLRFYRLSQKCWPKNVSSAGIHFAGVASGSYSGWDGFISLGQKPEELASGYLMIKEAGGYLIGTDGNTLDDVLFDWNKTTEIIAASTSKLGELIRKELLSREEAKSLHEIINRHLSTS